MPSAVAHSAVTAGVGSIDSEQHPVSKPAARREVTLSKIDENGKVLSVVSVVAPIRTATAFKLSESTPAAPGPGPQQATAPSTANPNIIDLSSCINGAASPILHSSYDEMGSTSAQDKMSVKLDRSQDQANGSRNAPPSNENGIHRPARENIKGEADVNTKKPNNVVSLPPPLRERQTNTSSDVAADHGDGDNASSNVTASLECGASSSQKHHDSAAVSGSCEPPPAKKLKVDSSSSGSEAADISGKSALSSPQSAVQPDQSQGGPAPAATSCDSLMAISSQTQPAVSGTSTGENDAIKGEPDGDKKTAAHSPQLICDPTFASYVKLDPVPEVAALTENTPREQAELERFLQFGDKNNPDNGWRDDWSGNLQLLEKELVMNCHIIAQQPSVKPVTKPFHEWVAENSVSPEGFRGVRLLFSYIYHMKGTPPMAQKLMSYALSRKAKSVEERHDFIMEAFRRISYDPNVLRQDGWTTLKASSPDGQASGGASLIGRKVLWSKYEAIVIAYVHDDEIGDLWKAMWLIDLETFDLEADELQDAIKKWEAKEARKRSNAARPPLSGSGSAKARHAGPAYNSRPSSSRYASFADFTVAGAEHGIILAKSFHQNARHNVLWPARIMHVSETKTGGTNLSSRRSSSQKNVDVVFLAPYWNNKSMTGRSRSITSESTKNAGVGSKATSIYSTGHLFEVESVEASSSTIQKYPYDEPTSLSLDNVRSEFRFTGLPKAAFSRFLDSHRLAIALKTYAKKHFPKSGSTNPDAFSALTECHSLSIKTPLFPPALLDLPYQYVLSQLPHPAEQALMGEEDEDVTEPILQLDHMLKAMAPPECFGSSSGHGGGGLPNRSSIPPDSSISTPQSQTPQTPATLDSRCSENGDRTLSIESIASEYLLKGLGNGSIIPKTNITEGSHLALSALNLQLCGLVSMVCDKNMRLSEIVNQFFTTKSYGEEVIQTKDLPNGFSTKGVLSEWRRACERVYKRAVSTRSSPGRGNGVTAVITDIRCNQHLTAAGSFERAVRIPAAIRGAKKAGAGKDINLPLVTKVKDSYLDLAEKKILPKAHKASYLKRMKTKIAALPADARGAPLTDDSDGDGGEDTQGSRGSYTAAVTGVAAALQGVDMVVAGDCVSAFCAVRPPGHHAGRELRPMNAVSNGFCVLNAAACAALYAVTPQSEGGRGLKRVCVIDFDVHHGNGTQDILCSTYDSRFLYVSLHAGGSHINGFEDSAGEEESDNDYVRRSLGGSKQEGIFPGKCGDTSPHPGVLNLPLGAKVTSHAIGTALVTEVAPAVAAFSPELIILSAGFDAHKHDPLGMGGLSAEDFGSVTDVACQMAMKSCSGRVLSLLEGGYGVPCCRPVRDMFLPAGYKRPADNRQVRILDLGEDIPESMEDEVPTPLQQKLDKCYAEGFLHCVKEHVGALASSSKKRR